MHGERGDVGRPDNAPDGERVAELIAAVAEVIAEEAGPGLYRRASERPVAPVSTLAGTRVPRYRLQAECLIVRMPPA